MNPHFPISFLYCIDMTEKAPYGWKDLLFDAAIIAVAVGIVLLIVGSFPESFGRFLPFLK